MNKRMAIPRVRQGETTVAGSSVSDPRHEAADDAFAHYDFGDETAKGYEGFAMVGAERARAVAAS